MPAETHPQSHLWSSSSNSTIAGASAGFVSSVVTCPLDVLKTKLQAQKIPKGAPGYLGPIAMTRDILLRDGPRGLYRGLGPTMLGYLPTWAIYFTVYDGVKGWLGRPPEGSGIHPSQYPAMNAWSTHIVASITAGATGTVITSPLWVVKTRFMTQHPNEVRFRHTIDAFRIIYQTDGIRAFYRGLLPSLLGVTHVVVQFPLYEYLKDWFSENLQVPKSALPTHAILVCTTISKSIATLITYPHEVVRTRLQIARRRREVAATHDYHSAPYRQLHSQAANFSSNTNANSNSVPSHPPPPPPPPPISTQAQSVPSPTQDKPRGTLAMIKKIAREDSWRGFYKGMGINLVRTIPNSAMTLLTYELVMRLLAAPP